ncbi:MAG: hypothetical protein JWM85_2242 [Acidimicrobiaceae bacterium]|nr:hypothetical protein [Acidimicrobiaceae bacterium]
MASEAQVRVRSERAPAGEIPTAQLPADVIDAEAQLAGQQIVAVPENCLHAELVDPVRVSPARRPGHHNCTRWLVPALGPLQLNPLRHDAPSLDTPLPLYRAVGTRRERRFSSQPLCAH